jgi:excisionase family DNA binding protein
MYQGGVIVNLTIPRHAETLHLRKGVVMELKSKPRRLLLRVAEVGDMLGCSRQKVYGLIKAGILPSVTVERMIRIPASAVEKLAEPGVSVTIAAD